MKKITDFAPDSHNVSGKGGQFNESLSVIQEPIDQLLFTDEKDLLAGLEEAKTAPNSQPIDNDLG